MRKLLVLQHVASEPLGHLDPLLRESGIRIRYVNFGRDPRAEPDIRRYDGLVVLGGPMNVDQVDHHPHLQTEMTIIREAIRSDRPVLGICLGAQLLAAAMGGEVRPNPVPEIGWYRLHARPEARQDPLFRHFDHGARQFIFQWHAYTFAPPPGAVPLAWTRSCRNQAYRLGDRAWGLQFHLEADEALITRWLEQPSGRSEIERHWDARRIARIQAATRRYQPLARPLADRVFGEFIRLFGVGRLAMLPSR
jgi:GMP synthase (glutamine-hydrolysing)